MSSPEAPTQALDMAAHRLHPLTLLHRVIKSLPAFAILLLPFVAGSSDREHTFTGLVIVLYAFAALPLIVANYVRFRYWVTSEEVVIHSGVFRRRKRNIPLERIQKIAIEQSLLPRLLGTAKVKIETAGSASAEGVLEYVKLQEAQRIRDVVRHPGRAAHLLESALFSMPLGRVLLSGAFRFSLIYILIIFSGLNYLMDALSFSMDDVASLLASGRLEEYAESARSAPWTLGTASALFAAMLGWLTGIGINVTKYYNYKLRLDGDKLHRRHGLLTLREGTIPLKRIQSLIFRSNPLMRAFDWFRLELQTVGYDTAKEGFQVCIPFARRNEILDIAPHLRPFALPETFRKVSPITIRRTFIRYSLVLLGLLAIPAYFWLPMLCGLAALPFLFYLAIQQYRNHGYAFADGTLYIKRGAIQQYLWIVPTERFQAFETSGTFFQRRLGLRSVIVDTAGAGSLRFPRIVDVSEDVASAITLALYARFRAHFEA